MTTFLKIILEILEKDTIQEKEDHLTKHSKCQINPRNSPNSSESRELRTISIKYVRSIKKRHITRLGRKSKKHSQ